MKKMFLSLCLCLMSQASFSFSSVGEAQKLYAEKREKKREEKSSFEANEKERKRQIKEAIQNRYNLYEQNLRTFLIEYAQYIENEGAENLMKIISEEGELPNPLFRLEIDYLPIHMRCYVRYPEKLEGTIKLLSEDVYSSSVPKENSVLIQKGPFEGYVLKVDNYVHNGYHEIRIALSKPTINKLISGGSVFLNKIFQSLLMFDRG